MYGTDINYAGAVYCLALSKYTRHTWSKTGNSSETFVGILDQQRTTNWRSYYA